MRQKAELMSSVESQLRLGNWNYERERVIGKVVPDFVVTTDNGAHIVLEVKGWQYSFDNWTRAINQARLYKELSKAAAALVILAEVEAHTDQSGGVIPVNKLHETLHRLVVDLAMKRWRPLVDPPHELPRHVVFASMPFSGKYDDTYLVAIGPAALESGALPKRADYDGSLGNIVSDIQAMIRAAKVVVADLSESRPNVLHEVGYAEAMRKPVIQICSTPLTQMPFNVRNNHTVEYTLGQTSRLRTRLLHELGKAL